MTEDVVEACRSAWRSALIAAFRARPELDERRSALLDVNLVPLLEAAVRDVDRGLTPEALRRENAHLPHAVSALQHPALDEVAAHIRSGLDALVG